MSEKKSKNNSIIKAASTSLVKAGNAIQITNKLVTTRLKRLFNEGFYLITSNEKHGRTDYYESIIKNPSYGRKFIFWSTSDNCIKAVDIFSEIIQIRPSFPYSYLYRGIARINPTNTKTKEELAEAVEKALEDYNKFIELKPKSPDIYYHFGEALSLFDYGEYIGPNAQDIRALAKLGGRIDYYNRAIELDPDFRKAYWSRANQSSGESSIEDYTKAIESTAKDSELVSLYTSRADTFEYLKEYEKAIRDYSKAIELRPKNEHLHNRRAELFEVNEDYEAAIKDYSKVIELDPSTYYHLVGNAYHKRASLKEKLGDLEGAREDRNKMKKYYADLK